MDENPFSAPLGPVPAPPSPGVYEGRFRGHRLRYWIEGDALHVDEGLLRIAVPLTHPEVRLTAQRFAAPITWIGLALLTLAATWWWVSPHGMRMQALVLAAVGAFFAIGGIGGRVAVGSRKRHVIIRVLDGDRARFDVFVAQVRERVRPGG
ncbi:MAG: hypothetical protein H0W72_01695 [Planctomycetes bacterium]|nr:hypothetical protein [Planctomycetota bacterium]